MGILSISDGIWQDAVQVQKSARIVAVQYQGRHPLIVSTWTQELGEFHTLVERGAVIIFNGCRTPDDVLNCSDVYHNPGDEFTRRYAPAVEATDPGVDWQNHRIRQLNLVDHPFIFSHLNPHSDNGVVAALKEKIESHPNHAAEFQGLVDKIERLTEQQRRAAAASFLTSLQQSAGIYYKAVRSLMLQVPARSAIRLNGEMQTVGKQGGFLVVDIDENRQPVTEPNLIQYDKALETYSIF